MDTYINQLDVKSLLTSDNINFLDVDAMRYDDDNRKDHDATLRQRNKESCNNLQKMKHSLNARVVYDLIINIKVDCIVNSANELLEGGGSIDYMIHEKGGQKLLEECKKSVQHVITNPHLFIPFSHIYILVLTPRLYC